MSDLIARRATKRLLDRMEDLVGRNPGDPKWWSDADKLRLVACLLDKRDYDDGVYDHDETQVDLRRIADRIEQWEN